MLDLPKKTIGIRLPDDGDEQGAPKKKVRAKKGAKKVKVKPVRKPVTLDDDKIFEPTLQIIHGKGKVINDLRKAANTADAIYLAGDPDREGEAISAHLAMVLSKPSKFVEQEASAPRWKKKNAKLEPVVEEENPTPKKEIPPTDPKKIFRVTFNEITPKAIRAAFDHPRQVDTGLVDAQQARRVLDRIVGYKVSPLLWDKVRRGLSAGRVQTVALRLIVERKNRAFIPRVLVHSRHADAGELPLFEAKLPVYARRHRDPQSGRRGCRPAAVNKANWKVASVTQRKKRRNLRRLHYSKFSRPQPLALYRKAHHGSQRLMKVELGRKAGGADHLYAHGFSERFARRLAQGSRADSATLWFQLYLPEKPTFTNRKRCAGSARSFVRQKFRGRKMFANIWTTIFSRSIN